MKKDEVKTSKTLVDTITISQDLGGPYERFKKANLSFWSDGSVTWEPATEKQQAENADAFGAQFVGDIPSPNKTTS